MSTGPRHPRHPQQPPAARAALLLLALLAGGCGSARIDLASLEFASIDPPRPQFSRISADHCYWWTDEDGRVQVAIEKVNGSLIPELRSNFRMHLSLDEPPAGRARNYLLSKEQLRGAVRTSFNAARFAAVGGIAALYRDGANGMRGTFRMQFTQEVTRMLGGWGRPARYLMLGEFHATRDEARGRAIAEAVGTLHAPPDAPTSQPVRTVLGPATMVSRDVD